MDISEAKSRVEEIKKLSDSGNINDSIVAHEKEDDLRNDFIDFIVNFEFDSVCIDSDFSEIQKMAKEILKTSKSDFARWCA